MPRKTKVTTFLSLSAVAGVFVGVLVYFGVRLVESAIIWGGLTFIVALVFISTLALMVPENNNDPDKQVLS
jgi:cation transporter-like permease